MSEVLVVGFRSDVRHVDLENFLLKFCNKIHVRAQEILVHKVPYQSGTRVLFYFETWSDGQRLQTAFSNGQTREVQALSHLLMNGYNTPCVAHVKGEPPPAVPDVTYPGTPRQPQGPSYNINPETGVLRFQWLRYGECLGLETRQLEFKRGGIVGRAQQFQELVVKYACAFLNASGGTLLLGVDDDKGEVVGLTFNNSKRLDQLQLQAVHALQKASISPSVYQIDYVPIFDKNNVKKGDVVVMQLVFETKSKPTTPYTDLLNKAWIRTSGACVLITSDEMKNWGKNTTPTLAPVTLKLEELEAEQTARANKTEAQVQELEQKLRMREEEQQRTEQTLLRIEQHHQQQMQQMQQQLEKLQKQKQSKTCVIL